MSIFSKFTKRKPSRRRSQRGVAEIAQFIPALYILFLLFLVPMLDLSFLFVAAATQYLATNDFAAKASTQTTFPSALNTMTGEAYKFQASGLAQFIRMVPGGGFVGCGNDLYLVATAIANGDVLVSSPNAPLTQQVDTTSRMYELQVKSTYTVAPLISFANLPLIGAVPGLGKPVTLNFTANRPIERPGGYQATQGGSWVGQFPYFANSQTGTVTGKNGQLNQWRTPTIFEQIKAAGQTVINDNVVTVPASMSPALANQTGGWVNTGLTVYPGQKVWLDTQAVGTWGWGSISVDANGEGSQNDCEAQRVDNIDYDLPGFVLIGYVGSPPILPYAHSGLNYAISGDPKFIKSGNTLLNFPINYTGPISLACNGNLQTAYSGNQQVRVIITQ